MSLPRASRIVTVPGRVDPEPVKIVRQSDGRRFACHPMLPPMRYAVEEVRA